MEEQKTFEIQPVVELQAGKGKKFWGFMEKNFLALSILFAGIMVSGSLLYANGVGFKSGTAQIPSGQGQGDVKVEVSADDDPVLGSKNAKVTMIEFSDYQCPFCRAFWRDALVQIKKDFIDTGKVRFVYRDYPLSFHPMAMPSAQAAECAGDQDKYWEMHDKIFSEEDKLGQGTVTYTVQDLKKWALDIGLNQPAFSKCLDSNKYKTEVEADFADGTKAGVSGTPSIFINGRLVVGAQPFSAFKSVIEEELRVRK